MIILQSTISWHMNSGYTHDSVWGDGIIFKFSLKSFCLKKIFLPLLLFFCDTCVINTGCKNSRESHDDVQRFLKIQFEAQSRRCVTSSGKKRRSTGGAEANRGKPGKWNKPIQLEATKAKWWAVFTQEKKIKRISFGVSNHNIIRVTPNSQNTLFYISGKIASNSRQVYVFVFSSASDQSKNSPETLDLQCLFFPSLFKYISPLVSSQ